MTKLEKIALACAVECDRQKVGLDRLGFLIKAYEQAVYYFSVDVRPTEAKALKIAMLIEPPNLHGYRIVPVTFNGIVGGLYHTNIPTAMTRLFEHLNAEEMLDTSFVHMWVKEFLDIHPFIDGNGRTAFILFNWLSNTFDDPQPLPDFYKSPI